MLMSKLLKYGVLALVALVVLIAIVFAIVVFAGFTGSSGDSEGTADETTTQADTEEQSETEEEETTTTASALPGLGERIQVGEIGLTALDANVTEKLQADNDYTEGKATSGKFVQVRVNIENTGSE